MKNKTQQQQHSNFITVLELQVLAGTIRSVKLAIRCASAWTREMNILIAVATAWPSEGGRIDTRGHNMSKLNIELDFWLNNIDSNNGAGIDHPLHQLSVYCDASVAGYGGSCGSVQIAGTLPTDLIGSSSTLRELYGLRQVTTRLESLLSNKRVRFIMDSQPAVANLTKGGGPVAVINDEIKRWWSTCQQLNIDPSYEWIPREQNEEADLLSKANEFKHSIENMTPAAYDAAMSFARIHGFNTFETPSFNSIDHCIRKYITDKKNVVMIVPEWYAQAWWPNIMKKNRPCRLLGPTTRIYNTDQQTYAQRQGFTKNIPKWNVYVVLFDPKI